MKRVRHSRSNPAAARAGFTLMEVLLVLAILGVIIGLVLPNLIGQQREALKKVARNAVENVEQACKMYAVGHNGEFPSTIEALVSNPGSDTEWKGPYLESVPADPWGSPLQYNYPGQNHGEMGDPDIWSMGPDRQSNTADDITNWTTTN